MSRHFVVISSLLSFLALTSAVNQCEDQFEYSSTDNRCYYESQHAATWSAASQMCRELNAQLLLTPQRAISLSSRTGVYWIGLQKNAKASHNGDDQCAVLFNDEAGKGKIDFFGCTNKYQFICQAEALAVTSTSTTRTTPTTTSTTRSTTTTRTTTATTRITTTPPNNCPYAGHPVYGPFPGVVSSPNYPRDYFNNANCVYTIVMQSGYATVTFNNFNTEACCDFLYLYNGPSTASPLIKRLSGTGVTGTTYKATSNTMTLMFTTDSTGTAQGWQANYYSS